jgi:hypothetical protein
MQTVEFFGSNLATLQAHRVGARSFFPHTCDCTCLTLTFCLDRCLATYSFGCCGKTAVARTCRLDGLENETISSHELYISNQCDK